MKIPFQKAQHPFTLIIFGASGSLARLKIYPALYQLFLEKRITVSCNIVGYGRTQITTAQFQREIAEAVEKKYRDTTDKKILDQLLKTASYQAGSYDRTEDYDALKSHLMKIEKRGQRRVRMAYFSVPPSVFEPIIRNLGELTIRNAACPLRLIIEKPFGYDEASAHALEKLLRHYFNEENFFLLDHYLGKEAVFNILSLRYANSILTRLTKPKYIENIQISSLEQTDIEGRGNYFDHVGTLRDMVQSHLMQILAFLTLRLPDTITQKTIHRAKRDLIESLKITDIAHNAVRGQYQGYRREKGVAASSKTDTFAALRLTIDNDEWRHVPIYLRTGKALKSQWTSIIIEFKKSDHHAALNTGDAIHRKLPNNKLVIQLQPTEKIEFHMMTKMGGSTVDFVPLTTGRPIYCSGDCLNEHGRLMLDVIKGDRMLFLDFPEVYAAWHLIDQLTGAYAENKMPLNTYKKGSLGPRAADQLLKKSGHTWHNFTP